MQALQLQTPKQASIIDIPQPEIKQPDDILVRLYSASFTGRALSIPDQNTKYPAAPGFPGHEGAGEIVAVGTNVTTLIPGDRVVLCRWAGDLYKEYLVCPALWAQKITTNIGWSDLPPTELFAIMLALLKKGAKIMKARCVIIGAGPAGLAAITWLKILGAREIYVIEKNSLRAEKATSMGIDETLTLQDASELSNLKALNPETVIECTGTHAGMLTAFDLASKEALLFGYNNQPFTVRQSSWFEKSLVIKNQSVFDFSHWEETVTCINQHLLDPGFLVTHTLPFGADSYQKAQELSALPEVYKISLNFF